MNKLLPAASIAAIVGMISPSTAQQECVGISDDAQRLECFDSAFAKQAELPSVEDATASLKELFDSKVDDAHVAEFFLNDCTGTAVWMAYNHMGKYTYIEVVEMDLNRVERFGRGMSAGGASTIKVILEPEHVAGIGTVKFPPPFSAVKDMFNESFFAANGKAVPWMQNTLAGMGSEVYERNDVSLRHMEKEKYRALIERFGTLVNACKAASK